MKRFVELFRTLDETRKTAVKVGALEAYFREVPAADGAWALAYLLGNRQARSVTTKDLRVWAGERSGHPAWLVDECYDAVGDLAETLALLVDGDGDQLDLGLAEWIESRVLPLKGLEPEARRALVEDTWSRTDPDARFLHNKLITGGFRVGVAKGLVVRALAAVAGVDRAILAHRLAGRWQPTAEAFQDLLAAEQAGGDPLRPYPFLLAHPLQAKSTVEGDPQALGEPGDWQAEWKWDGIRAQAVRRAGELLLWSRGEELVAGGFPEIVEAFGTLPDGTVLDGELLAWDRGPLPFHEIQRRIRRKSVGPKLRAEVPVAFLVFDLLEADGVDLRGLDLRARGQRLDTLLQGLGHPLVRRAEPVPFASWEALGEARQQSRARGVEGLMLKRLASPYGAGRVRGDWWKWKVEPYTIDTVLMYAQRGHGRRASLYTDYTLGVWDGDELVPVAKAYSGLTDKEIGEVDRFVRRNIEGRFGPVRVVAPAQVFEIAFEGIQPSTRHKAGISLRFPRIARWRTDKAPKDADRIEDLRALMADQERP